MEKGVVLATVKTTGNLSGYVYLHLPSRICKAFNIVKGVVFTIVYSDGKLVLEQKTENGYRRD